MASINLCTLILVGLFTVLRGRAIHAYGASTEDLRQGPSFLIEPSSRLDFYNSTGGILRCSATGVPKPKVTWAKQDGSVISDIPRLRHLRPDGSLVFPPFSDEDYRQDVHGAIYRCVATNSVGKIGSREVKVRGSKDKIPDICLFSSLINRLLSKINNVPFVVNHFIMSQKDQTGKQTFYRGFGKSHYKHIGLDEDCVDNIFEWEPMSRNVPFPCFPQCISLIYLVI